MLLDAEAGVLKQMGMAPSLPEKSAYWYLYVLGVCMCSASALGRSQQGPSGKSRYSLAHRIERSSKPYDFWRRPLFSLIVFLARYQRTSAAINRAMAMANRQSM